MADRRRLDELVGLAALVGGADRLRGRVGVVLGAAVDEQVVGLLRAVPALVAVHGEVATDDGADAPAARVGAPALEALDEPGPGVGERVAAVREGVDDEVADAEPGGQLDQRPQVLGPRVHAAVAGQPDEVHALGSHHRLDQHLVGRDRAVLDGLVDARQVLLDDRAGAEVEVADLTVAHLARGQPDGFALGLQLGVRIALPEGVEDRRVGLRDRIARPGLGQPPTVEHDEADRRYRQVAHGRTACWAASMILVNASTSSDAPPTRAPSTSGRASSSAAVSALTLPP